MILTQRVPYTNTIYSQHKLKNTGGDNQMVLKSLDGQVTRILVAPIPEIDYLYDSCSLRLYCSNAEMLNRQTSVYLYPIITKWQPGIYTADEYPFTQLQGSNWLKCKVDTNWTYQGGDTASELIDSINLDYRIIYNNYDFQNISPSDQGYLIKLKDQTKQQGVFSFYSSNTEAPFYAKYVYYIDDYSYNYDVESVSVIEQTDNLYIDIMNLQEYFRQQQIISFKVKITPKKYRRDWTSSYWTGQQQHNVLLQSANLQYSIYDVTQFKQIQVIQYSPYTRISCNNTKNYFNFDMNSLQKNRKYKFQLKINNKIYSIRETFKIV